MNDNLMFVVSTNLKGSRKLSNSHVVKTACLKLDRSSCGYTIRYGTEKRNTKTEISQGIGREINLMRSAGLKTSIRVFIVMVTRALIQLSLCEAIGCMFPYGIVTVCMHTLVHISAPITYERVRTSPLFVILLYLPCSILITAC